MALSVPLSRFTPRVGGGSAFFVRPLERYEQIVNNSATEPLASIGCCKYSHSSQHLFITFTHRVFALRRYRHTPVFSFVDAARLECFHLSSLSPPIRAGRSMVFASIDGTLDFGGRKRQDMRMWPNQLPEPTAVVAAVAIHAASRRWLSFFRR